LLIYHYGLYTLSVRYYQVTRGRRLFIYHNITPARYFRGWDREQELLCDVGRRTLSSLVDCDLALGDSDFNRRELLTAGFTKEKTGVLPIFLPQEHFDAIPTDHHLLEQLRDTESVNFLTVGRVVPNKAIEDVIRIFYVYHGAINPHSRLYIVGSRYLPTYDIALDALVMDLGLNGAVVFARRVSDVALKTYYQAADLYLMASHHEGFCLPLVESMYFGVPILARKAAATPETLGEAGVLFTDLGYEQVAEMAHLLLTDDALRRQIIRKQKERLHELRPEQAEAALRRVLARLGLPNGT
jgi:glycosyltransferase involved in cell wall biosynthesis